MFDKCSTYLSSPGELHSSAMSIFNDNLIIRSAIATYSHNNKSYDKPVGCQKYAR
jgi:hypothetical protein